MIGALPSVLNDPAVASFYYGLKSYIDEDRLDIPVLPQSAGRVMRLLRQPDTDATALATIIHLDQGLAAAVLRVSNSPVYRGVYEIQSLRQAIARLGVSSLGKVVLSVSMGNEVFNAPGFNKAIQVVWRYSLAAGEFSQRFSRKARADIEETYLCGLLHSVGKPVVLKGIATLQEELKMKISSEALGLLVQDFHKKVGKKVAIEWGLPDFVQDACMFYEKEEDVLEMGPVMKVTHLAHRFASFLFHPTQEGWNSLAASPVAEQLGFDEAFMTEMREQLPQIVELVKSFGG